MIKLGVTGGIGSGKSVVCNILRLHGIPVFDADKEAKNLNNSSPVIREKLISHFGKEIYRDGKLDKQKFAKIIFKSEENVKIVNSIIHPELAKHFLQWVQTHAHFPVVAMEAALIFEAGFDSYLDKVITVSSPEDLRISRVMKRDKAGKAEIEARKSKQMPEEEKINMADYVIENNLSRSLIEQVSAILNHLKTSHR